MNFVLPYETEARESEAGSQNSRTGVKDDSAAESESLDRMPCERSYWLLTSMSSYRKV